MNNRNKRLTVSGAGTLLFFSTITLLPIFNSKVEKDYKNKEDCSSQIAVVSVMKKITPKSSQSVTNTPVQQEAISEAQEIIPETMDEPDHNQEETSGYKSKAKIKAEENYKSYVLSRIASKKVYPIAARTKGQTGRVKMLIQINKDGSLKTVAITKSCQFDLLNEACVQAVKKSAPFKKMPPEMSDSITIKFSMDFLLNDQ